MLNWVRRQKDRIICARWNIGIADLTDDLNLQNACYLSGVGDFRDHWFADPFPVEETEDFFVILCEEMVCKSSKGRIVRLLVRKEDFSLEKCEVLLENETHLSFPHPLRIESETYICPENGQSGKQGIWRYGKQLTNCGVMLNASVFDPVVFYKEGFWWLLATTGNHKNGNKLDVYRSDQPLSGYMFFKHIDFDDNIARRAGGVFLWNGRMVSPAQICNTRYGEGLKLPRTERIIPESYRKTVGHPLTS